jgi:hypothetical protein
MSGVWLRCDRTDMGVGHKAYQKLLMMTSLDRTPVCSSSSSSCCYKCCACDSLPVRRNGLRLQDLFTAMCTLNACGA